MDEIQAAVLRVKLRALNNDNSRRLSLAWRYREILAGIPSLVLPTEQPGCRSVWHQYVIRCTDGNRDAIADGLRERGVQTLVHYPVPIHRQPAYAARGLAVGALPETERAAREVLSLPMFPQLVPETLDRVRDALAAVC